MQQGELRSLDDVSPELIRQAFNLLGQIVLIHNILDSHLTHLAAGITFLGSDARLLSVLHMMPLARKAEIIKATCREMEGDGFRGLKKAVEDVEKFSVFRDKIMHGVPTIKDGALCYEQLTYTQTFGKRRQRSTVTMASMDVQIIEGQNLAERLESYLDSFKRHREARKARDG